MTQQQQSVKVKDQLLMNISIKQYVFISRRIPIEEYSPHILLVTIIHYFSWTEDQVSHKLHADEVYIENNILLHKHI